MMRHVKWATVRTGWIVGGVLVAAVSLAATGRAFAQQPADEPKPVGITKATIFLGEFT